MEKSGILFGGWIYSSSSLKYTSSRYLVYFATLSLENEILHGECYVCAPFQSVDVNGFFLQRNQYIWTALSLFSSKLQLMHS